MDSVETYLADILAAIRPLPPRELTLADALATAVVRQLGHGRLRGPGCRRRSSYRG
jgi:hypothetical protein